MASTSVRAVEDKVVGHLLDVDAHVCFRDGGAEVFRQVEAVSTNGVPAGDVGDVEAGGADDGVELNLAVSGGDDAFLGDALDGGEVAGDILFVECFEIALGVSVKFEIWRENIVTFTRGEATAANFPLGDELLAQ